MRSTTEAPDSQAYAAAWSLAPTATQAAVAAGNRDRGCMAHMQVSAGQGALLTLLTAIVAPSLAVEVGTFTGYSALALLRGLPSHGRLICFELNADWAGAAWRACVNAGQEHRVDMRVGPATWTLRSLAEDPLLDLVFLDADKTSYLEYYELLIPRMRPGGLMIVDNVLQGGRVLDPLSVDEGAVALREFNRRVKADHRVQVALVPAYDGVTLVQTLYG